MQCRNYGPAGSAAAGAQGKKGPGKGLFSSHIGRDRELGAHFWGGAKLEFYTPLNVSSETSLQRDTFDTNHYIVPLSNAVYDIVWNAASARIHLIYAVATHVDAI